VTVASTGDPDQPSQPDQQQPAAAPADATDRKLDEALESTFPASDPVAAETPER
jgi:hypothetical protein